MKVYYDGKSLCIQSAVDDNNVEKLQNLFKSIQMMSTNSFFIHCKDINGNARGRADKTNCLHVEDWR